MNTYNFNVKCKSGQWKDVTIQADNFREARAKLAEFVENN